MSEGVKPPKSQWKVSGLRIDNGESVTLYVEARSRESAGNVVALHGVTVSSIEPVALPYASPPQHPPAAEPDLHHVHLETVRPGAAFALGFYAFLGGAAAWIVVGGFIALVTALIRQALSP